MRNKKLINRRNDITQGGQFFNIALEKEGKKKKKKLSQHGVLVVGHPAKY